MRSTAGPVYPFFKPSCTPASVTIYLPGRGPDRECDQWRAWALRTIASLDLDRVVVASSLPAQVAGASGGLVADDERLRRWTDGMAATIRAAGAGGAEVTVLSDAPGLGQDAGECLLRRKATMATCTAGINSLRALGNGAAARAARREKATFVDLSDWFCARNRCPTVIGTMIAYKDDNHVSRTYALHLSEPLGRRLELDRR